MTIGSFGLNESDLDSLASLTYVTPDSPSSITAILSTTHTLPSFGPKMDAEEHLQRLEQELVVNRAANAEINNSLWAIMQKLNDEPG